MDNFFELGIWGVFYSAQCGLSILRLQRKNTSLHTGHCGNLTINGANVAANAGLELILLQDLLNHEVRHNQPNIPHLYIGAYGISLTFLQTDWKTKDGLDCLGIMNEFVSANTTEYLHC